MLIILSLLSGGWRYLQYMLSGGIPFSSPPGLTAILLLFMALIITSITVSDTLVRVTVELLVVKATFIWLIAHLFVVNTILSGLLYSCML